MEEIEQDWIADKVKCLACGYEWVAVYPVGATVLECPTCGEMTPIHEEKEELAP